MQWNHGSNLGPATVPLLRSDLPSVLHASLPPLRLYIDLTACHACCQLQYCLLPYDHTIVSEVTIERFQGLTNSRGALTQIML